MANLVLTTELIMIKHAKLSSSVCQRRCVSNAESFLALLHLLLIEFFLEVLTREADQILGVGPNDFFAKVL